MKTLILATGTTREKHLVALEAEYLSRFPKALQPTVKELPEGKTALQTAATQLVALHDAGAGAYKIALDERGALLSSPEWAAALAKQALQGTKTVVFIIGGADGLTDEVRAACNAVWGLGRLTFPHQLVRGLLAEQLYRAHTINTGHPYHRV